MCSTPTLNNFFSSRRLPSKNTAKPTITSSEPKKKKNNVGFIVDDDVILL